MDRGSSIERSSSSGGFAVVLCHAHQLIVVLADGHGGSSVFTGGKTGDGALESVAFSVTFVRTQMDSSEGISSTSVMGG